MQSAVTTSLQPSQTPGFTGEPCQAGTINCLVSDHPSETCGLDPPPWLDMHGFDDFEKDLDLIDFDIGTIHDIESPIDPQLYNPSISSPIANPAAFDIQNYDWPLSSQKQGQFSMLMSTNKFLALGSEFREKKRRRSSVPHVSTLRRKQRRKTVLFPIATSTKNSSSGNTFSSSYNPYAFSLLSGSPKVDPKVGESKSTVNRIVTMVLSREYLLGLPTSWRDSLMDDQGHEAYHLLHNFAALPMEKLVNSCFREHWGVGCFLQNSAMLKLAQKLANGKIERDQNAVTIVEIFLLGIIAAWGATIDPDENPVLACALTTQIIDLRQDVASKPDSISKFLAFVAMVRLRSTQARKFNFILLTTPSQAQFAFKTGLSQLPAILAETISIAQSLNLHREAALQSVCQNHTVVTQVQRACWVLFCVDKAYAMRWRTFSKEMLPSIEYDPPPHQLMGRDSTESHSSHGNVSQSEDWLLSQCRYAKICARISGSFASLPSSVATTKVQDNEEDDADDDDDDYDANENDYTDDAFDGDASLKPKILTLQKDRTKELLINSILTDLHSCQYIITTTHCYQYGVSISRSSSCGTGPSKSAALIFLDSASPTVD
ncbi:transcription factor fum21 [Trichoderma arundinaceum]|uniref:Transcription factor fum21 n=1 Tax=Trichoderma arundinaceum TaxID=490622 RepID=A0A395NHV8_TRIAR|nr:transcription factor fum21 [Trichoderma arundinaceum]